MKLIALIIVIGFSLSGHAQKIDTSWTPKTDSTEFISLKDMNKILGEIGDKVTFNAFNQIRQAFEAVMTNATNRKRGKN